ncbi:iron ABC transporter permease, partial [Candidatus Bipolaricaulota bacterium]|nr:iron ABC transporter permease [Candidatus Bipolaricaulota bacterium]
MIEQHRTSIWILALLPTSVFVLALFLGRYGIQIQETVRVLLGLEGPSDVFRALILRVRLPRVLAAACVGANLSVVGAAFQGLFRNPLVDSRILGVSSGAAFGAALALLFTSQGMVIQASAFVFAMIAIALVMLVGVRFGSSTLVLVIGGILVGALFNSFLGLIKYVADPLSTLPAITYWLLGSLNATQWSDLPPLLTMTGLGLPFFMLLRWRINLLTVSDTEALAMGIRVRLIRTIIVAVGTMLVAASVALAGTIGWIGLVVPHVAR